MSVGKWNAAASSISSSLFLSLPLSSLSLSLSRSVESSLNAFASRSRCHPRDENTITAARRALAHASVSLSLVHLIFLAVKQSQRGTNQSTRISLLFFKQNSLVPFLIAITAPLLVCCKIRHPILKLLKWEPL